MSSQKRSNDSVGNFLTTLNPSYIMIYLLLILIIDALFLRQYQQFSNTMDVV